MRALPRLCEICEHYREEQRCDAFPYGIPDEIFYFGFDHRKEYPQDNGIRFELRHSCYYCANYIREGKCLAFKKGIPEIILLGKFDHTKEFPGDKGYRFKPSQRLLKLILKHSQEVYQYVSSLSSVEREEFLRKAKKEDVLNLNIP